jgi:cyanophycin synthetase
VINIQQDEVRRLTGPNLLWDKPGAIADLLLDGIDKQQALTSLQRWSSRLLLDFGWEQQSSTYRSHALGINFAISAPMDQLYSACDLLELAWDCCTAELLQAPLPDWQGRLVELKAAAEEEQNPQLLALMAAAQAHQVSCLVDDDELSLGMGRSAQVWPVGSLPELSALDWSQYRDIPRALVTGTNGKSTSVRLAAHIAKAAGMCAGVTSTDSIRVGEDIIDHGDYSGPGGARMLLRDKRSEIAFLEVARGGILRRGLPLTNVDVALITNVASDHLGQYGINTVEELAVTKFVVAKALDEQGILVLNGDNHLVVEQARQLNKTICWFSTDEANPLIQQQLASGGRAVFVRNEQLVYHAEGVFEEVAEIADIAMTFNGAAMHNVENALGVVGLCKALNLPNNAISQGLHEFGSDAQDNPGRGNIYQVNGCQVIVDFAHNEHGMRAVVDMARQMSANKYICMFGHGGDRSDQEIQDLSNAVLGLNAHLYIPVDVERYFRGRQVNEVPTMVKQFLMQKQVKKEAIQLAASPLEGAKLALAAASPGDVVLLFVLDQREAIHDYLSSLV